MDLHRVDTAVTVQDYLLTVRSDLYRHCGRKSVGPLLRFLITSPGLKYSFLMRSARYLRGCGLFAVPLYVFARLLLRHCEYKYGISIAYNTNIGRGLYIGHFGGIVVHYGATIGKNCNLNHDVTVGATYGGKHPGVPVIGDNVYLGPGSKVIGGITLGNNVSVGANCVVNESAPDNAVIVGIPGKIVSYTGSTGYVINADWEL